MGRQRAIRSNDLRAGSRIHNYPFLDLMGTLQLTGRSDNTIYEKTRRNSVRRRFATLLETPKNEQIDSPE